MNHRFKFKRFEIHQRDSAMKVGTDGVLLGAWCSVRQEMTRALDIGVGTGLIALMLAQRSEGFELTVDGVEIDTNSYGQALENIENSEWAERINIENISIQEFAKRHMTMSAASRYDLIISNPPYFMASLLPPDIARTAARHTTQLTHSELVSAAIQLLAPNGLFALILPYEEAKRALAMASERGLWLRRRTEVVSHPGAAPKRLLMEFSNACEIEECITSSLTIELSRHQYTTEYMELTREFYLKF